MFWRILLLILALIVFIGITWVLLSIGMILKRLGNLLIKKIGVDRLSFPLPILVFLIIFAIALVPFIINLVNGLKEWTLGEYLFTVTPVGSIMLTLVSLDDFTAEGMNFWGILVTLVYQTGAAGLETLIITVLSASFLRNLTDERGLSFFPAALICFVFSFIVSIAVSSLNQVIPFVAMAKHFTGPAHDFGWVLLLLLLIGIIVFFAVGWFGEMILQLSRFIGIGLTLGSIPGILSGTNDISFGYGDPLFWVFFIILIIYWIVRKMQIEPLEDVIEYASDDFIQNKGRSSIWVPFVY